MSTPIIITEDDARALVSEQDAFDAIAKTFKAMASGEARNFPVTREALEDRAALFGFKSGYDQSNGVLGVKAGGYWSNNEASGLSNHQSSTLVFNPLSGQLSAVVSANYLTSARTAAAAAVSISLLARSNAKTLSIVGAGKQAEPHVRAALSHRGFDQVLVSNRTHDSAVSLSEKLSNLDQTVEPVSIEAACRAADVLITIVSSFEPVVSSDWISPGTHIAAMGTDTKGKQELDAKLAAMSCVYCDEVQQSIAIGEAQHAFNEGTLASSNIIPIGAALLDPALGRTSEDQITLFDSTGVGLQDLAVAKIALDRSAQ